MGITMDRRQKKTRNAIFSAFITLLEKNEYDKITVERIISLADVGRATFYSHFETKDYLLKELCEELFCHLFDCAGKGNSGHTHLFECQAPSSIFLHLFLHLQNNDNGILKLLSSKNNQIFAGYFKENLMMLFKRELALFKEKKKDNIPEDFWINYLANTFVETVTWWVDNGKKQSAETIYDYFISVV